MLETELQRADDSNHVDFDEGTTEETPCVVGSAIAWRELLAVLLLIVLSDLTIYRGEGFAGVAVRTEKG